jgi:hypothetical protein
MPAATYTNLGTYTVTGSNLAGMTGVTFSTIDQNYTDLHLVVRMRATAPAIVTGAFNGGTGNFTDVAFGGQSGSTGYNEATSSTGAYFSAFAHANNGTGIWTYDILNYSSTNTYKTIISQGTNPTYGNDKIFHQWSSNSAITSIKVALDRAEFILVGSTFNLYGIKAGS